MLKPALVAAMLLVSGGSAVAQEAAPESFEPTPLTPPEPRHVSIFTSAPLLATGIDLEYERFYGFLSTSLAVPAILTALNGRYGYWAFSLGAGLTTRFGPESHWSFEFYGMVTPGILPNSCYDCGNGTGYVVSAGVGAGIHATFDTGVTLGFKLPLLGYAYSSTRSLGSGDPGNLFEIFYLYSAIEQPIISIGYRW